MKNKSISFLIVLFFFSYQLFGMDVPQLQLSKFCPDVQQEIHKRANLQSLGRLKNTSKHFNSAVKIDEVIKFHDFSSVERYLYHYAPKLHLLMGEEKEKVCKHLGDIINFHNVMIDEGIGQIHSIIKQEEYSTLFVDTLVLDDKSRLSFYCGKLPGRIITDEDFEEMSLSGLPEDDPVWDITEEAHYDALMAVESVNIPRLKAVLDRYGQFPNGPEGLLSALCELKGCSDLVINYISLADRGIDYTEDNIDAGEFAGYYKNEQLMEDLAAWISTQQKD